MTTTRYGSNDGAAAYDTFVYAAEPSKPHNKLTYALIGDGTAEYLWNTALAGIPKGATVSAATFSVFSAGDWSGSVELSCTPADAAWAGHTATWNNRPGIAGHTEVVTHSPGAEGVEYAFDMTIPVQNWVAAGGGNGFKVKRTDAGGNVRIWQRESASANTPVLIVTWTAAGQKPDNLSPNGVVGVQSPTLQGFPKNSTGVRVQIDGSSSGFGSPDWESGTVDISVPELDLSTTDYPGGALDDDQWWRVSTRGTGGGWSDYSDPIKFTYVPLHELTITGPSELFPYVTDPSPTITWTMAAQVKFRLFLTSVGDGDREVLYDTGQVTGDAGLAHTWTIPHHHPDTGKIILKDRNEYRVWVQAYDELDRVAVPGAQIYAQEAQVFTFTEVGGVPPFDYLVAAQVSGSPQVQLDFGSIGGPPDQIAIWRDDEIIDVVEPEDVDNPDTGAYTYIDWKVPPGTHDYYAERVVNGSSSVPGPHDSVTVAVVCHWLVRGDEGWAVKLHNVGGIDGLRVTDQATQVRPLGSRKTVKRTTAQGYFEGPVWGWIMDDDPDDPYGRTADDYLLDLRRMANNPSLPVTLAYTNFAFPVLVGDHSPLPLQELNGVDGALRVEFNVLQQNDWTIFDTLPESDEPLPEPIDLYTYEGYAASHVLTIGEEDITAVSSTPTVRANDGTLHTDGEKYWNTGGITRACIDGTSGGNDVYCRVPVKSGFGGGSIYKLKNPAGANPADVRLRSAGTIDIKDFDGVTTYTADIQWTQAEWLRGSVAWTWDLDLSLGASMGWLTIDVALYFGLNVENTVADCAIHARYPSLQPVNETNDGPGIDFEVGRRWPYRFLAYPYGTPPPPGDLIAATSLEAGHATQTTMELSGFTGLAAPGDLIGLNRSASSSMTSPTAVGSAAVHDATGHSRWSATGLTANTDYWWQMTNAGTPYGPIIKGKTLVTVGTSMKLGLAVTGCKQNSPASTAVSDDIAAWSDFDRTVFLGDNGYPANLGVTPEEHAANFARQSTDPARMQIAALGCIDSTISDHDTNGAHGISNQPNYHDATTAESILCWPLNNAVRMDDVRSPKRDRGVITYEGNFVIMQPDTRSWDKTDNRDGNGIQADSNTQTMLGATQLARFLAAITAAAASHKFIIWLTDPAWNGRAQYDTGQDKLMLSSCDKWPAYIYERDIISDHAKTQFTAAGSTLNMVIGSSDSHALQYDDGTNAWSDKNGIVCFIGGPFCQNSHALFGPDSPVDPPGSGLRPYQGYEFQFPANAGQAGRLPTHMMWFRSTFDNTSGTAVDMTLEGRDCTPSHGAASTVLGPYTRSYTL